MAVWVFDLLCIFPEQGICKITECLDISRNLCTEWTMEYSLLAANNSLSTPCEYIVMLSMIAHYYIISKRGR